MSDFMVAFCPHCSEPLYRSTKPMEMGQQGSPSDFQPIAEHIPPPDGDVPTCYECGGTLKVVPESVLKGKPQRAAEAQRTQKPTVTPQRPVQAPQLVETLFEVGEGEQIVNLGKDTENNTIILTNKRIVRLRV